MMHRRWRITRLIGSVLLLFLAAALWWFWPHSPRWRRPLDPTETIVGLNEQKAWLHTFHIHDNAGELQTFDLATGAQKRAVPISIKPKESDDSHWIWILSPDKATAAACGWFDKEVQIFEVASGKRLASLTDDEPDSLWGAVDAICFSADGRRLATRDWGRVCVWDTSSGHLLHSFKLPDDAMSGGSDGRKGDKYSIDLSADGRYLAVAGESDCLLVYDLVTEQILKRFSIQASPRFLPDSQSVLLTPPYHDAKNHPSLYQMGAAGVTRVQTLGANDLSPRYWFGMRGHSLVAFTEEFRSVPFAELLPQSAQEVVGNWLGPSSKVHLAFWNPHTGRLQRRADFTHTSPIPFHYLTRLGEALDISEDGRWIIVDDGKSLTCWDGDSSRSVICWIICVTLVVFSCWLAWPRRVTMTWSVTETKELPT